MENVENVRSPLNLPNGMNPLPLPLLLVFSSFPSAAANDHNSHNDEKRHSDEKSSADHHRVILYQETHTRGVQHDLT